MQLLHTRNLNKILLTSKINPSIMSDFSNSNLGVLGYIQGSNIHMHHQTLYKHTYLSAFNIVDIQKYRIPS